MIGPQKQHTRDNNPPPPAAVPAPPISREPPRKKLRARLIRHPPEWLLPGRGSRCTRTRRGCRTDPIPHIIRIRGVCASTGSAASRFAGQPPITGVHRPESSRLRATRAAPSAPGGLRGCLGYQERPARPSQRRWCAILGAELGSSPGRRGAGSPKCGPARQSRRHCNG